MRVLIAIALMLAGAGLLPEKAAGAGSRQAYTSIKDVMQAIIDPSADVVWQAVGTVVDNKGFHDALPRSAEEWRNVRLAAVRIVEGANLLMMPGRPAAPPGSKSEVPGVELEPSEIARLIARDRASFDGYALALQTVAMDALKATDVRNGDRLMDAGGRMEEACEGCHQAFWYPNAGAPQTAGRSRPAR